MIKRIILTLVLLCIIIFVDKKIFKQKPAQSPINFPPNKTIFLR